MTHIDIANYEWQIITNPNALTKERTFLKNVFIDQFDAQHIHYQFHVANGQNCGAEKAKALCQEGCRHFIIIGGDGTINEAINGIYDSGVDTTEIYVAIVPLGTGNDYCRTLGMPNQPDDIIKAILTGNFAQNDVGIVETIQNDEIIAKRHFINIAGFAFDAAVINKTVGEKPKILPSLIYILNLVKVLFGYKCTEVTIKAGDETLTAPMFTIAVGIAQYNGNGMRQVPMANPSDRLFDVVTIREVSAFKVISKVKQLFSGEHIKTLPEAKVFKCDTVEITGNPQILGEVEGEMLVKGNYRIYNASKQINVISPAETE